MDPISLIVTALSAGAAAALKPTSEKVVKDAYEGLRTIIRDRYSKASSSVESLESKPDSELRRGVVKEDLEEGEAAADADLLRQAQQVLEVVQRLAPEAATAAAVDLEKIRTGASVNIEDIVATGTGVRLRDADVGGDINIRGVDTRDGGDEGS